MVTMKTWLRNILLQKNRFKILKKSKTFLNKIDRRFAFNISYWCQINNKNRFFVITMDVTVFASIQVTSLNIQIWQIRLNRRTQHAKTHLMIPIFKGFYAKSPRPKSPLKAPFPVRAWMWRQVTWPIKNSSKCSETLLRDGVGGS